MSTLAVIFNPTKIDRADIEAVVEPARAEAGWEETLWLETAVDDPGVGMAREAVEKGVDVVLAVGGDGTIRCVAEGLRGSSVPLALAPQGTGNLLARNLDLTLDNLPESVDSAINGRSRPVDLGVAEWERPDGSREERVFVVAAGVGLDAQIMSNTDEALKKRVGMLAYVKAGVEALFRNRRMSLTYRLDDAEPERARLHTILVGNCGSIGGNVLLLPDAAVDDGVLDVVGILPRGVFGWPRVIWKVLVDNAILHRTRSEFWRKQRDRGRELNYQQCREIQVTFRRTEEIELDGDHFGEIVAVDIRVEEKALLVQMPSDWTPDDAH
ncbi:diacylglycerol kinase family protein [Tessaracoccus lubricantis]|uniref:Diacylglycerol kinase family protein n=1 Tax=Tessaracoccus lubricantis TaxID=545543 RepID=A0ABP9F8I7_9ACTN